MNQNKRIKILKRFQYNNPIPKIELHYNTGFELLIAVILSAKSTDIAVNLATTKLYSIANTPEKMVQLSIDEIKNCIKSVGLFNNKAKNISKLSNILYFEYNGKIPNNRNDLESLPGVGRKTANVVLNILYNKPTIAVDTHVFRVCNRTHFATGYDAYQVECKLIKLVPNIFKSYCHLWFVLHGRYICKAKNPICKICIIKDLCEFKNKNF